MPRGLNTSDIGDKFRDSVATLLAAKYEKVEPERKIAGKNVDIYVEYYELGATTKVGFECKHYGKALTSAFLREKVFPHYRDLITNGALDFVVIIANQPIAASVRETIEAARGFRFRTFAQLEEDVIGLRPYIETLSRAFDHDPSGLPSYYVRPRFKNDQDAISYLDDWLAAPDSPNIAILGGYGTGKTSLAKFFAAHRAKKFLASSQERIPILVSIGSEVYETKLESMFGKLFSASFFTNHFRFNALTKLNEDGRLLLIFDGFDEMKHAMTSADFRANFSEINKLVRNQAKVLLLGRPNALTSDDRALVLRGTRRFADVVVPDPNWPEWKELEIDRLNSAEIDSVLSNILAHHNTKLTRSDILDKVTMIRASVSEELLARPIQTRLIATIAASRDNLHLKGMKLFHIYHYFVDELLKRDLERHARSSVSIGHRRDFQERLAFWSWLERERFFYRDLLPAWLFHGIDVDDAIDDVARANELIVSTLTEEKEAGVLYFAHRSIQEFLVSQYFIKDDDEAANARIDEFVAHFEALTPEIRLFIAESRHIGFFRRLWLKIALYDDKRIHYPHKIIEFLKETPFFTEHFVRLICQSDAFFESRIDPRQSMDILVHIVETRADDQAMELLEREALRVLIFHEDVIHFSVAVYILMKIALERGSMAELVVSLAVNVARRRQARRDPSSMQPGSKAQMDTSVDLEEEVSKRLSISNTTLTMRDILGLLAMLYGPTLDGRDMSSAAPLADVYYRAMSGDIPDKITVDLASFAFPKRLHLDQAEKQVKWLADGLRVRPPI